MMMPSIFGESYLMIGWIFRLRESFSEERTRCTASMKRT